MLKKLRAALAIAGLWAVVWLPLGLLLALYAGLRPPEPMDVLARPVNVPAFLTVWTAWGGLSGALFAALLSLTERRRTLASLSVARAALWGALGSITLPAVLTVFDLVRTPAGLRGYGWPFPTAVLAVSAALGAACAAATLGLARRPTP